MRPRAKERMLAHGYKLRPLLSIKDLLRFRIGIYQNYLFCGFLRFMRVRRGRQVASQVVATLECLVAVLEIIGSKAGTFF